MRRAVEFMFTRVLRSRAGAALVIAVLVLGVIATARLVAGSTDATSGLSGGPARPITTVDPSVGDDGVIDVPDPPAPVTSPGELTPEQTADRFTAIWLGGPDVTADQWQADLRPLSTPELTEKLAGADPAAVPAERVVGRPTMRPRHESFVELLIPLDSGQLRLELVAPDGRWLVDAVDWERA
ncbi:hypothetical protein GCM10012279_56130 [Micromonospora yangpuensis]|uniref:Uncharacterized protein n=2 Tax=Micromonosporaceae TaxID=28056 RepID=A0A1C6VEY2_9ACTN|nr:hypothetical protein GCM10012279_56130 [Micromonospora yangpuensis]SCL64933.1 hypothetical protein GA0070617_5608 [Micromonospora yangpuensis]